MDTGHNILCETLGVGRGGGWEVVKGTDREGWIKKGDKMETRKTEDSQMKL